MSHLQIVSEFSIFRTYFVASSDDFSLRKLQEFEKVLH